ncbi:hypothetical protein [Chitinophaga rhizophila]|uniref:FecR N-terminal domain-containing protein n=1 Tax=Chitinophaga rhizophila TaxID=2866212 RepID=A0ABS7G723_9BACT|nr:hypothetical protein [Chitinophaga rhizophila]MBW8683206.1 hypothetical protein [Chitinophaga rhizophila]
MNRNDVTEFVIDCLTDARNADKQAALHQWLLESPGNHTMYTELQRLWEAARTLPPLPFNIISGWDELVQQTSIISPQQQLSPHK